MIDLTAGGVERGQETGEEEGMGRVGLGERNGAELEAELEDARWHGARIPLGVWMVFDR